MTIYSSIVIIINEKCWVNSQKVANNHATAYLSVHILQDESQQVHRCAVSLWMQHTSLMTDCMETRPSAARYQHHSQLSYLEPPCPTLVTHLCLQTPAVLLLARHNVHTRQTLLAHFNISCNIITTGRSMHCTSMCADKQQMPLLTPNRTIRHCTL